jgi:hypothetical protein
MARPMMRPLRPISRVLEIRIHPLQRRVSCEPDFLDHSPAADRDGQERSSPACRVEVCDAGRLIREAVLELDQRTRKIGHDGFARRFRSTITSPFQPPLIEPPDAADKL